MKTQNQGLGIILSGLILAACAPQKVAFNDASVSTPTIASSPDQGTTTTPEPQPPTCQPGDRTVFKPTKFVFIVDQSGSNTTGAYENPDVPTDPLKAFRFGVINQFFQTHGAKTHLSWSFISFGGTQARAFINQGSEQTAVFSNQAAMAAALLRFRNTVDGSTTPYRAAFMMARDLIARDRATNPGDVQYRIAFITDGYPTDYCPGGANHYYCPGSMKEDEIDRDLMSIINIDPSLIQFSAVYYGAPDRRATSRLQRLARLGGGQVVDTNTSSTINLDDLLRVPQPTCQNAAANN